MDDMCEQAFRRFSAQLKSILVGGDHDGARWVAGIINIDLTWQNSSKNAWYCQMICAHFLKERRDG
jgi:hypothetical protein